jgi:dinuclear metal center YbgI/SA1388 family protein
MTVKDITDSLEALAPLSWAEDFDNVGLLVGDESEEVTGILVALDCLENVVEEAILKKANMIVSFHPIIFKGLKQLRPMDYVSRVVLKCIQNNIAIYSMHTAFDNAALGVNFEISQRLGLKNIKALIPNESISPKDPSGVLGMGRIGQFENEMNEKGFLVILNGFFARHGLKPVNFLKKKIMNYGFFGGWVLSP